MRKELVVRWQLAARVNARSHSPVVLQRAGMTLWVRMTGGLLGAVAIALAATGGGLLTPGGGVAAVLVGVVSVAAGWPWGTLLVLFFFTSTALTRWRGRDKREATREILPQRGARNARQVLANGAVFAGAGAMGLVTGAPAWWVFGLGALSASGADTWATEIGTAVGGAPRHVLSWRLVPPGTSGGVTGAGTLASVAGAITIGAAAFALGFSLRGALAAVSGGICGALADTLLGATVQERRRCPACDVATEQLEHRCGSDTHRIGGITGVNNDVVNLASTVAGGGVAVWLGGGVAW